MDRSSAAHRGLWFGVLALLLLLAVAWLAIDDTGGAGARPVASAHTAAAAASTAQTLQPLRARPVDTALPATRAQSSTLQICDAAPIVVERDGMPPPAMQQATEDAIRKVAAHLAARGDDRSRAYATVLSAAYDTDLERRASEHMERCRQQAMPTCNMDAIPPGDDSKRVAAREALARLALTTLDPEVYARAWQACLPINERRPSAGPAGGAGSACMQLSLQRWTALDAGNAVPWMHVLAQPGLTPTQTTEALHQIAQSQRVDHGWGRLPAAVIEVEGSDVPRGWLANAAVVAAGIDFATMLPYSSVTKQCDAAAVTDANRRQTCAAIAELLGFHGNTMIDRAIGGAIGRKLGWPAGKQRQIDDERDALMAASFAPQTDEQPLSCASYDRMRRHWMTVAQNGEAGLVQAALAASGESLGVLAERGRRLQREFSEQIRAADAAASAASAAR